MTIFSNEVLPGSEWNTQIKKDKHSTEKNQSKIKLLHNFNVHVGHIFLSQRKKNSKRNQNKESMVRKYVYINLNLYTMHFSDFLNGCVRISMLIRTFLI